MRHFILGVLLFGVFLTGGLFIFFLSSSESVQNSKHFVVYMATREEVGTTLLDTFCQKYNCTYEYVKLSSEEIVSRMESSTEREQVDLILGGTLDAHLAMSEAGYLKNVKVNQTYFPFSNVFPYEMEQIAISWIDGPPFIRQYPQTWEELLDLKWAGKIVLPDPNHSGTGMAILETIFLEMGEEQAKDYIKRLKTQVSEWTATGYAPSTYVASGDALLGINFVGDQVIFKEAGYDMNSHILSKELYSLNAVSTLQSAPNSVLAEQFIQYLFSEEGRKELESVSTGQLISTSIEEDKYLRTTPDMREHYLKLFNRQ